MTTTTAVALLPWRHLPWLVCGHGAWALEVHERAQGAAVTIFAVLVIVGVAQIEALWPRKAAVVVVVVG